MWHLFVGRPVHELSFCSPCNPVQHRFYPPTHCSQAPRPLLSSLTLIWHSRCFLVLGGLPWIFADIFSMPLPGACWRLFVWSIHVCASSICVFLVLPCLISQAFWLLLFSFFPANQSIVRELRPSFGFCTWWLSCLILCSPMSNDGSFLGLLHEYNDLVSVFVWETSGQDPPPLPLPGPPVKLDTGHRGRFFYGITDSRRSLGSAGGWFLWNHFRCREIGWKFIAGVSTS